MAQRTITTRLALDGEQEFRNGMASVNNELKTLKTEMQRAEAEFQGQANTMEALTEKDRILRREIEQQQEKVKALAQAVVDASEAYGDADKRTDSFRQSLNRAQTDLIKMNRELEDTDRYLEEARKSADGTADSIDEFGKKVSKTEDPLSGFKDSLGTLKTVATGGAVVGGLKAIAGAIIEVVDGTKEYRQIMGTLETSSQAAGYTAEQTAQAYDRLYGVLGDTQTTATTVANLQAIGLSQNGLMEIIDAATGAWATYGDSIPIDGLAEAINETIKAGQVTGTFADVLNWAGVSEDEFNEKLAMQQTEASRAFLVLDHLRKEGLIKSGEAWRTLNDDIVKSNESQREFDEAMGELGEALSPIRDGLRDMATVGIGAITEAAKWAIKGVKDLIGWLNDLSQANQEAYGSGVDARGEGRGFNGSHAGGLDYVPYDGYVAELHEGERIQTRAEADVWRSLQAGAPGAARAVTAAELQQVTAAAVNGLSMMQQNVGSGDATIVVQLGDGTELARALLPDFRKVSKSDPEVS